MDAFTRACEIVGGNAGMAKVMGVSPQFISQILKGERSVPAKHCIAIETATAGKVTRYELCEEVFGPAPRKAAAA